MDIVEMTHPEIILNHVYFPGVTDEYANIEQTMDYASSIGDESLCLHYMLVMHFQRHPRPVVFVNKDMFTIMASIDKNIPVSYLPDGSFFYAQFPEGFVSDGEDEVIGAYCYLGPAHEIGIRGKFELSKVFVVSYVCRDLRTRGSLLIDISDSRKLLDIMKDYPHQVLRNDFGNIKFDDMSQSLLRKEETIFRMLLNLILFSEVERHNKDSDRKLKLYEPEVEKPTKKRLNKIRRDKTKNGLLNLTSIAMLYLDGADLRKMIPRNDDGLLVNVSGHFRWQPHGVERKLLKLIWIDEYQKTYTKQTVMNNFKTGLDQAGAQAMN